MSSLLEPCQFLFDLETEHRAWLSAFDLRYLRNWEKVRNGDCEAALSEAAVRRFLQSCDVIVKPNEELSGSAQRPDFRCRQSNEEFFVEVVSISIEKVVKETGLPHPSARGARPYRSLNDTVFNACKGKATQCGAADRPALVAVCTFHFDASVLCFKATFADMLLTGRTNLSWLIDTKTGRGVGEGYQTTELYSSLFLRPDEANEINDARASISGVLLCGFGTDPPIVRGVLHPNAARPFDRVLLPSVEFGEVQVDRGNGRFSTSWSRGDSRVSDDVIR
jgi:hypothetical protein